MIDQIGWRREAIHAFPIAMHLTIALFTLQ